METVTHEIAPDIFRFSTLVPGITPDGFSFNQFLIRADEPMLFHCGPRAMFPLVSEAAKKSWRWTVSAGSPSGMSNPTNAVR